jgi:SAM-dependent methyltransferase
MNSPSFDQLTDFYESMVDWPKRLAGEGPFLKQLFESIGAKRIADVACGTGHHAALFHSWGLDVLASDISPSMIARARQSFGEPPGLRWTIADFTTPVAATESLDAVVCLGNSLALVPDLASVDKAIGAMLQSVRTGGLVIIHVLNLWKLPDGPCVWQKVVRKAIAGRDTTIIKGVHRHGDTGRVELIAIPVGNESGFQSHSVPFLGLTPAYLEKITQTHRATPTFHGSAKPTPYTAAESPDLIMVARKH